MDETDTKMMGQPNAFGQQSVFSHAPQNVWPQRCTATRKCRPLDSAAASIAASCICIRGLKSTESPCFLYLVTVHCESDLQQQVAAAPKLPSTTQRDDPIQPNRNSQNNQFHHRLQCGTTPEFVYEFNASLCHNISRFSEK